MKYPNKSEIDNGFHNDDDSIIADKFGSNPKKSTDWRNRYTLYYDDNDRENMEKWCSTDYYLNEKSGVRIVDNGFILPVKKIQGSDSMAGGVCDANGNFVAGHQGFKGVRWNTKRNGHTVDRSYSVSEAIPIVKETVVYGGVCVNHFGRMISECLSRMWWHIDNTGNNYKFVFISFYEEDIIMFKEFFLMIGIMEDNIVLIKQPTRFEKIIVPEQSYYHTGPFNDNALSVFNTIRDSVKPAKNKKIYLTKSKLSVMPSMNEEYFENYFKSKGYEIVAPEKLSIREQIEVMAGAEEIACTRGTLPHMILFSKDKIKLTILNMVNSVHQTQLWINQARKAQCTYINVSIGSSMPILRGVLLLLPTKYWKQYLIDHGDDYPCNMEEALRYYAFDYIEQLVKFIAKDPSGFNNQFTLLEYSFADLIIGIHKNLLNEELSDNAKSKLYNVWPRNNNKNG